ncbi:SDR family oxidoreductase [bacterium]|nr:MAG: SDR family oxidoreductase [bacterium]
MENQIALITGSGRRLGRRIAIALAEYGFDIVINYNQSKSSALKTVRDIRKLGRRCIAVKADVTKITHVRRLMKETVKTFGKLDVLVNNAAIFPPPIELKRINETLWDTVIDTNLKSSFLCAQEASTYMIKRKSGKIINIASLGAYHTWPKHIPYCVSKAGIVMLTKVLAKALAPHITVNAVAPGTIIIPNEESSDIIHPSIEKIPLKKYGMPSDITDMVVFLALSSKYITGQVIKVDGGATIS